MGYVKPEDVFSPKDTVTDVRVLIDRGPCPVGGPGTWSLAVVRYDRVNRLGFRWNGCDNPKNGSTLGHPSVRGYATWVMLPDEIERAILASKEMAEEITPKKMQIAKDLLDQRKD
jgi:hypothetical protein